MTSIDRRRNNGPGESYRPKFLEDDWETPVPANDTHDRKFFLKPGLISSANGSAYFEQGKTKLLVTIHGPRSISKNSTTSTYNATAKVTAEFKYAPFACRERHGYVRTTAERDLENKLIAGIAPAILAKLLPKSEIAIFVQVLEEDGELSTLAGAIIATSAALCDAGIECVDLVSAIAISVHNGALSIWPTRLEEESLLSNDSSDQMIGGEAKFACVIAYLPQRKEITALHLIGSQVDRHVIDDIVSKALAFLDVVGSAMAKGLLQ